MKFIDLLDQMDRSPAQMYSLADTAHILSCPPRKVYELVKEGILDAYKLKRRIKWISAESLASFVEDDCAGLDTGA